MKNLQNLKGVKALNRAQQQSINGGDWTDQFDCEMDGGTWVCIGTEHNPLGDCGCLFGPKPNDKYK